MPDHEDSLGGETFSGEEQQDPAGQSLGDGATMGGDTAAHSLGDQSTFGDAHVDDDLFDDGMKLVDLSERYTEESVLGKGGFGEVKLAVDTRLNRKVAIKRIQGKAARSKTAVLRFLNEAQSIAGLSHNNIVQIYDYGRATDGPFLIMECVQGGSLLDQCRKGPIELDEAVKIFSQVCDGLAKAHAENIIHRDIKPANILMTEDGVPKLTDFGLAKDDTADTGMTMEGAVIGTLDFMPPEQRQGAEFTDHRSDLWSLAATFYQMLTGKSPKVINITSLPQKLQSVVAKALEQSKEDRFQSAMEMREAILQAHSGKMDTTRSLGEGECPQCATLSPPDQKFCRNCSAQLQVNCLGCLKEIAIWDNGCGSCGAQQAPLVDKALADLKQIHDQAESLLADLEFDAAAEKSEVVASETDSRLQKYAVWHAEFSARLESSRTSEHARLAQLLQEALTHEQAYDYEAGLKTLQQIAAPLKQTILTGIKGTAKEITKRLTTNQSRLKELEATVRERVTKREIAGLLTIVHELLTLKPDRPEVQKLMAQLEKRDADLLDVRDANIKQATQQLGEQQYAETLATLNAVSEEVWNAQLEDLKTKASDLLNQLNILRDSIASAVNGNQLKGLLPIVEECLTLKADQDDLVKLKEQLEKRDADLLEARDVAIKQATQQLSEQQYAEALATLNKVSEEVWNEQLQDLEAKASDLLNQLNNLRDQITGAISDNQFVHLLPVVEQCLVLKIDQDEIIKLRQDLIARQTRLNARNQPIILQVQAYVQQQQFTAALQVLSTIPPEGETSTTAAIRQKTTELASEQASAVVAALAKEDWREVLALDPGNIKGMRMQAAAQKERARLDYARDPFAIPTDVGPDPFAVPSARPTQVPRGLSVSLEEQVINVVAEQLAVDKAKISRATSFLNDLGADSLDTVELIMELEEEFDLIVPESAAEKIHTVGQAIDFIELMRD